MPFRAEEKDVKFNTKTKIYPNGATNSTYCNHAIFKSPAWEDSHKEFLKMLEDKQESKESIEKFAEAVNKYGYDKKEYNEEFDEIVPKKPPKKPPKSHMIDYVPRSDSLKRAKDKVFDIAFCNSWDYFITITFNPDEVDSFNANEVIKKLRTWLNDRVKRKGLKYLLIPEYHKSGRIHCHALVNDVLTLVPSGHKLPDGREVYNISEWLYGFSTAIQCDYNTDKLAYYVTKYITKGNDKIFGRFFWSSRNLVRSPDVVYSDSVFQEVNSREFIAGGMCYKYDCYFGSSEFSQEEADKQLRRILNGEV